MVIVKEHSLKWYYPYVLSKNYDVDIIIEFLRFIKQQTFNEILFENDLTYFYIDVDIVIDENTKEGYLFR